MSSEDKPSIEDRVHTQNQGSTAHMVYKSAPYPDHSDSNASGVSNRGN